MTDPQEQFKLKVTRRGFLKSSAAVASSVAALNPAHAAQADSGSAPLLYLPPLLACPTETSIRITALNEKRAAEAVIELRKEGVVDWERQKPALKLAAYEVLNWT